MPCAAVMVKLTECVGLLFDLFGWGGGEFDMCQCPRIRRCGVVGEKTEALS